MGYDRLKDKVAIVTGAGQGIGEGIAKLFAEEGAKVVVATRTEKNGQDTIDQIRKTGGEAILCTLDIGNPDDVNRVVDTTAEQYGRIDVMVHNAASFLMGSVERTSEEDLETVLSVNLKACFRLSKACIPYFKKQGAGRLLFTSSVTGPRVVMPGTSYYAASKGGMNAFIRTAAIELARDNITVNGVEPGYIRTAAMEILAEEEGLKQMAQYIPMGYLGDPMDIAYPMLFLATDEARYITGQTIIVDGGSTLPESPAFLEELESIKNPDT